MLDYYKENIQFYILLAVWMVVGIVGGPVIYVVLPLTMILMRQKGMWEELFLGFFFILILSDSELNFFVFAKSVKVVYLVLLAIFFVLDLDDFRPLNLLFQQFGVFFLVAIICLFLSPTIFISFQKTFSYILMFILIPNFITRLYRSNGEQFFKNLIYFGTTILIVGFILYFIQPSYAFSSIIHRYNGVFGNPNGLGLYTFLLFALFYTLNDVFENLFTVKEKVIMYSSMLLSIVFSNSRNAFISVVILIVFDRFFKKSSFLGIIFSFILFIASLLISDYIPILIKQMGLESFFRLNTLQELSGRAVAWQFAWSKIQNNYFISRGYGYDEFTMRANYHMLSKMGTQGGVHSSYLSLWLNFGLVGLLVYLRSFLLIFIKAIKINRLSFSIMYAVLFSAAFEGLFIGSLNPQMIILIITMTIISDSGFYEKERELPTLETP